MEKREKSALTAPLVLQTASLARMEGGKGKGWWFLNLFFADINTYFYHVVIPCGWGKSGHEANDGPLVVGPYPCLFPRRVFFYPLIDRAAKNTWMGEGVVL